MQKEQHRVFLGYYRNAQGKLEPHPLEAPIVFEIYHTYIDGASLQKISEILKRANIPSSQGKADWGRQAISNVLCNEKYMGNEHYPTIVPKETFDKAQTERARRTAKCVECDGIKTKRTFNTATPLTGLLFCAECGKAYRRITRASGEVVWRCANRVEHGSEICKSSPTVKEKELVAQVAKELNIESTPENSINPAEAIKRSVKSILVQQDGSLIVYLKE